MMSRVSLDNVVQGALAGVMNAHKAYAKWSGGGWLWEAPEYMTTIFVAQEISKLDGPKYVTLEHSAKDAMEDAGAKGRGKLHRKIRANGKFDILLWSADESPRAPIEVKGQVTSIAKIKNDLSRIEKVIHRKKTDSSFQFGMMVFYTALDSSNGVSAKKNVENCLDDINKDCKELLKSCKLKTISSKIYGDKDNAWAASAITLKPCM